jgi:DNA-binding LacI/PurR family transcriptional regulator
MPTIKDVAREAGVSIATVSYVLNGKHSSISTETRRLVWEAAERIGYMPNATARNLRASRSRLIGYEWHEVRSDQINAVLDRFTYHLARSAEEAGYHVLTFTSPADDPVRVYDELLRTGRVDAFVVSNTRVEDPRIRYLIDRGFPFVSFGRANPDWEFPWIDCDGRAGIRMAVEHLIAHGHQRIAMLAWPEDSLSGEHRVQGYRDALAAHGLPMAEPYLVRGIDENVLAAEALDRWAALAPDLHPTAVVSVSDQIAIGLMNQAESRGIAIGRDLSLIGFDDTPTSQHLRPALTTVRQPIVEIGAHIMHMLEVLLGRGAEAAAPGLMQRLIAPELVERGTVATVELTAQP